MPIRGLIAALFPLLIAGCPVSGERPRPAGEAEPATLAVAIASRVFQLEEALEPASQFRGLSGRQRIDPYGGMVFAHRTPRPLAMVMRDCPVPIDVAFLDRSGRILAFHAMRAEPARGPRESRGDYERRLPVYRSGRPASFAVEVAGGRLAELGIRVGDRMEADWDGLVGRAPP